MLLLRPALRGAGMLFDWLYPAHFPTILTCLEAWADTPDVTTALLKFMVRGRRRRGGGGGGGGGGGAGRGRVCVFGHP